MWPKEAITGLGRPLNRWDVCPNCGKPPSGHAYSPATNEYRCLSLIEKQSVAAWKKNEILKAIQVEAEAMYLAAFQVDDIAAADEAKRIGRNRAREKFLDRLIGKTKETPVETQRKYFDE